MELDYFVHLFFFAEINFTLFLNESNTDAALPVQLIKINPKQRAGCAKPKRANTFAPAPSPKPITYLTCKKSNTVTISSPNVFNDGNGKLRHREKSGREKKKKRFRKSIYFSVEEIKNAT